MISPKSFFESLIYNDIEFFTGVPDSLLKNICSYIADSSDANNHIIAANEGNAIAIASGYHLATHKLPLVYLQNSGLGNTINPLLSLCDPEVYSIPLLVLIGWRGEPGTFDEPQHISQGRTQLELLNAIKIPYEIISKDDKNFHQKISSCSQKALNESRPVAIIVKKGTFENYVSKLNIENNTLVSRESFLEIILDNAPKNSIIISTTGKTSREIFELREKKSNSHSRDFLTVGSMGHCSSIALGIAIKKPKCKILCIDGDGSLIMHMGSLSTIGQLAPKNFYHILINNYAYESVGGQPTSSEKIVLDKIARYNGYNRVFSITDLDELKDKIPDFFNIKGPCFLELISKIGSRKNLGRPNIKPIDNKVSFMDHLKSL